jgi:NaMN:DMB phosphoribosyltransferase
MKTAKAVQAIRQRVKVSRDQRIDISVIPFHPGSEVEVIVVAAASVQGEKQEAAIYGYAEKLTHEKAIP